MAVEEVTTAEDGQPKLSKEEILQTIGVDDLANQESFQASLEAKFQAECDKARKRAERFGVEYKEPDKKALFEAEYKRASRMRPDVGFYIGMDLTSQEEQAKIASRGQRWGGSEVFLKAQEDAEEDAKKAQRAERFGISLLGPGEKPKTALLRKMGLYPMQVYHHDTDRVDPPLTGFATYEPTKVHLFALDKLDFKSIRSGDVLKFFDSYFPRYVEWLGDTAANIIFDDAIAAQRALDGTSIVLPPIDEVMEVPKPDAEKDEEILQAGGKKGEKPLDISQFGWRLGRKRILKSKTDAWGERGTAVRVLLRLATTSDILQEMTAVEKQRRGGGGGGDDDAMDVEITVENEFARILAKRKERKRGRKSGASEEEGGGGEEEGPAGGGGGEEGKQDVVEENDDDAMEGDEMDRDRPYKRRSRRRIDEDGDGEEEEEEEEQPQDEEAVVGGGEGEEEEAQVEELILEGDDEGALNGEAVVEEEGGGVDDYL